MKSVDTTTRRPAWWCSDPQKLRRSLLDVLRLRFTEEEVAAIWEALKMGEKCHRGQTRSGGEPYIVHPLRVASSLILEFGVHEPVLLQAALLHDVLEDSALDAQTIAKRFGPRVHQLVAALTRSQKRMPEGDRLEHPYLEKIMATGTDAILVKIADKIDNLRDALRHPRAESRRLYVEEGYKTFLLMAERLSDGELRDKAIRRLEDALRDHSFFRVYTLWRYYVGLLAAQFRDLGHGEHVSNAHLENRIYRLDRCTQSFLLFNPELAYWLTADGVQVVKTIPGSVPELASKVAALMAHKLRQGAVAELVDLASLPRYLSDRRRRSSWHEVRRQLEVLADLLGSTPPAWLLPALSEARWILIVIHSRLFLPASWSFPLWQPDFGASVVASNGDLYREVCDEAPSRTYRRCLERLLEERLALWRYHTGVGSTERLQRLLGSLAEGELGSRASAETLLAMRFVSEYLEVASQGRVPPARLAGEFTALWEELAQHRASGSALRDRGARLLGRSAGRHPLRGEPELVGFSRLLEVSRELGIQEKLLVLADRVLGEDRQDGGRWEVWLSFDVPEILKRREYFFSALGKLREDHVYQDLERLGFLVDVERFGGAEVRILRPGPSLALRNRLPEMTDDELGAMARGGFSAQVMFDELLRKKLADAAPFWTPRVFRILDSIGDLDPDNVQRIWVSYQSEEPVKALAVPLPLPAAMVDETARAEQEERKEIVARFLAVMIYNSAITTSVESARIECAGLDAGRSEAGFSGDELLRRVSRIASEHGYEAYGRFAQGFNFRTFRVTVAVGDPGVAFAGEDMRYGAFLGLDVGGTEVKMCLFERGEPNKHPLHKFPTFGGQEPAHVPVFRFIDCILDEADRYLDGRLPWARLDGIGISWPGAVRDSKIVGYSRTLGRLEFPTSAGERVLQADSSPQEIQSLDLVGFFYRRLQERRMGIPDLFSIALENDGNAEAYGNFCLAEMQGGQVPGGKVVVKLGTSLAGGHIDGFGAISPHVSEFSKVILDFSAPPKLSSEIHGPARDWVSSIAVRRLSRSFVFEGETLFGSLGGHNASDRELRRRVEAAEVGELLLFWRQVDDEPIRSNTFLRELVEKDNLGASGRGEELRRRLVMGLADAHGHLRKCLADYVYRRGCERHALDAEEDRADVLARCETARRSLDGGEILPTAERKLLTGVWQLGLERLGLLITGSPVESKADPGELSPPIDGDRLATKVLGAVALFSQLGLQAAHLIVLIYNIYRKARMQGVILAGGVLTGASGLVVKNQTERFLLKFYDKVFGPGKNLGPNSIRLAQVGNPAIVGPLGAAMVASRVHKMRSHRSFRQAVHDTVDRLAAGQSVEVSDLEKLLEGHRVQEEDLLTCLRQLVADARLLPSPSTGGTYLKM